MKPQTYTNIGISLIVVAAFLLTIALSTHTWSYICILLSAYLFLNGILIVTIYLRLSKPELEPVQVPISGTISEMFPELFPVPNISDTQSEPEKPPEMFHMGLSLPILFPTPIPESLPDKKKTTNTQKNMTRKNRKNKQARKKK